MVGRLQRPHLDTEAAHLQLEPTRTRATNRGSKLPHRAYRSTSRPEPCCPAYLSLVAVLYSIYLFTVAHIYRRLLFLAHHAARPRCMLESS